MGFFKNTGAEIKDGTMMISNNHRDIFIMREGKWTEMYLSHHMILNIKHNFITDDMVYTPDDWNYKLFAYKDKDSLQWIISYYDPRVIQKLRGDDFYSPYKQMIHTEYYGVLSQ